MCGITGIWTENGDQGRRQAEVTAAVASLRHRGPDDEGIWLNSSGLGLGHTRLSILDLSSLGHQPMRSPDGRFVIVFNGEIYNFMDIRAKLAARGHAFEGSGDTEVILHAFAEWGSDAVKQFIGMFAIALWDEQEQKLELIRDRIGVKPLHWGWDGKTLCFGSELKALREYRHWRPEIDLQSLGEFLQYGYIAGNRTIYKGVHKLEPAHRLTLRRGQSPVIEPYWSVLDAVHRHPVGSDEEIEAELESLLVDAFRLRMVSDVPVGVYLSGGVDSSLVTAMLARHHEHEIRTFTIGFAEDTHDESRWAKKVAEHCRTSHTQYVLGVDEALEIAKNWGSLFDEPFGDPSGIPTLLVSRLAKEQVKVVLSADGGDELFSGYKVYETVLQRAALMDKYPKPVRRALSASLGWSLPLYKKIASKPRSLGSASRGSLLYRLSNLQKMLADSRTGYLMDMYMSCWKPDDITRLIGAYDPPRKSADAYPGPPAIQLGLWDFETYLPEDILTKVDRTTMAVSIEGREPLLDHRVAEYAFALPPHLRRGELGSKHILKRILHRYVPREIVDRPKQGFAIPLDSWLKSDLKELVTDYLSESRIRNRGIMDPVTVREAIDAFYKNDAVKGTPIWHLLSFEMWREAWNSF